MQACVKSPTRMIYGGARYYDPREARWMSRDPALEGNMAGGGVGDPRNLLSYGYAFNSPISYSDPDGRQSVPNPATASPSCHVEMQHGRRVYVANAMEYIIISRRPQLSQEARNAASASPPQIVSFDNPGARNQTATLSPSTADNLVALVRRGTLYAGMASPGMADNLNHFVDPANHGEDVIRPIDHFTNESVEAPLQIAIDRVVHRLSQDMDTGALPPGGIVDRRGQELVQPDRLGSVRERAAALSVGTYTVAVRAVAYRPTDAPKAELLSFFVQFGDRIDFDRSEATIPIDSSLSLPARIMLTNTAQGLGLLTNLSGDCRPRCGYIVIPDPLVNQLVLTGRAHNFNVFSPVTPLGTLRPQTPTSVTGRVAP